MFRQFFSQAAELKSAREIGLMRESGKIVAEALRKCRELATPGRRTIEIDQAVAALYARYGATPLFKGLPDDRCQSPHWGYVLKGSLTFNYSDHEETYEAGDAYYGPPGHIPRVTAGTEVVEFSPAEEYRRTQAVLAENLAAAGA